MSSRLRVFLCAPNIDFDATGESYVAWKWAEALSEVVDLTVFSFQRAGRMPLGETLPRARALTAPMPHFFSWAPTFERMAKPYYPIYMRAVRRTLARETAPFDIAHQIMPLAARFPLPFRDPALPYVVGPLGGTLETPKAFRSEMAGAKWYTQLRAFDRMRFRYDPWLRKSYGAADLVLGVAPYIHDAMSDIALKRFEVMLELGISDLPALPQRPPETQEIQLLHVGRAVRTKGLRDLVRAMALLKDDIPGLRLTSAGAGEEIGICKAEAKQLGVLDRIDFRGQISRAEVEILYAKADIFAFPSFREPTGGVLYEAMRWGLPIITADVGGPASIVDEDNGILIPVTTPDKFAVDISDAIRILAQNPDRRRNMGLRARERLEKEALWPAKAKALVRLYQSVLRR